MKRASSGSASVHCCCAPGLRAESAPDLAALEQTAQKRHAEWETLAKDLSERMARILPCDPRSAAAITEVSRASEARLAALADYLRAASAQAFAETAAAKILLNAEERAPWKPAWRAPTPARRQTAVDMQSDALAQSVKQRASLEDPQKASATNRGDDPAARGDRGTAGRSRGCGRRTLRDLVRNSRLAMRRCARNSRRSKRSGRAGTDTTRHAGRGRRSSAPSRRSARLHQKATGQGEAMKVPAARRC